MQTQNFDHKVFESYWQGVWEQVGLYEPDLKHAKKPFYNLMMFPYPSALGLHVGNVYAFVGSDIYGRFTRMRGYDVFEPIGLDGFGIHSENFALKIGKHPVSLSKKTQSNIYKQLRTIGNAFDWSKKLETYDTNYYKWTQWIFIKLFKAGLAYRAKAEVNWCPKCLTVLADEQVIQKNPKSEVRNPKYVCERCESEVEKRELEQWFFRTTWYAQRLLDGLDKIDWSEKVKIAQRNWIGRSEGIEIMFQSDIERDSYVKVFTTRVDTIYGVTYMALAPEHPLVTKILKRSKGLLQQEIQKYVADSLKKTAAERMGEINPKKGLVKTGVFCGFHCTNPLSGKRIPIYIADYVLMSYGTGAVMGVPAHDQRDFLFARKYQIDIVEVVSGGDISRSAFTGEGMLVNSGKFNGLSSEEAREAISKHLIKKGLGQSKTMWHLRDWIISRQRYWGPPIPMVYCASCAEKGQSWFTTKEAKNSKFQTLNSNYQNNEVIAHEMRGWYPVSEENLPVELPYIENFKPRGSGVSPLASDPSFVKVKCPSCGFWARRETDVSDTFLDSAWYFLRYPSQTQDSKVKSQKLPWDREITQRWLPVDMYIGGAEHSVLHLLYSRFLTMAFYDMGFVDFMEPFTRFRAHGLLIREGAKMSKSKGNIVLPDPYIAKYGADTLRTYLMFCGRFSQGGDFRDTGIEGMHRFLRRVWGLVSGWLSGNQEIRSSGRSKPRGPIAQKPESLHMMHKTIKKVTEDIESLSYNTAIAAIMEWVNALEKRQSSASPVTTFPPTSTQFSGPSRPVDLRAVGSPSSRATRRQDEKLITHHSSLSKLNGGGQVSLITEEEVKNLLLLLAPFAPHMTEELWQQLSGKWKVESGKSELSTFSPQLSIHLHPWPKYDPKLAESAKIEFVVQVNGKVRDKLVVEKGIQKEKAVGLALASERVTKHIGNRKPKRTIFIKDRLINFVV